jgi:hypothetical protein
MPVQLASMPSHRFRTEPLNKAHYKKAARQSPEVGAGFKNAHKKTRQRGYASSTGQAAVTAQAAAVAQAAALQAALQPHKRLMSLTHIMQW